MGVRSTFYAELRDELDENPFGSFLFRFLLDERRESFRSKTPEELLELLADRKQKLQLDKNDRLWLWTFGAHAGGPALQEELKRISGDRPRYKLILDALRGHSDLVTEQELDKLREAVLHAVVMRDARMFLYDAAKSWQDDPKEGRALRRKDRTLKMLDDWCEEKGFSLCLPGTSGSDTLTEAERQDWDKMFTLLQRMEQPARVILPVLADTRTGIGLYLVSMEYFPRKTRKEMEDVAGEKLKYVFVCLGGHDVDYDAALMDEDDEEIRGIFLTMCPLKYTSFGVDLADGELMFSSALKALSNHEFYTFFRDQNQAAPHGTPKRFLAYFQSERQEKLTRKALAEQGRRKSEQDSQNNDSRDIRPPSLRRT